MRNRFALFACFVMAVALPAAAQPRGQAPTAVASGLTDWIENPESLFLTDAERLEFGGLRGDEERKQFIDLYWARRDPTPNTPANEFRDAILSRIKIADQKFPLGDTPGSRTQKGHAYVVFGPPARMRDENVTPSGASDNVTRGSNGYEVNSTWFYDTARTPRLLAMLKRPSVELHFVTDPLTRKDQLQNPALMKTLREELAERSIVAQVASMTRPATAIIVPGTSAAFSADVQRLLDAPHGAADAPFSSASMWRNDGSAVAVLWITVPKRQANLSPIMLYGRVKDGERTVAQVAREVSAEPGFSTAGDHSVYAAQVQLPAGTYDADFVLVEENSAQPIAKSSGRIVVPPSGSDFAVSSVLLTNEIAVQPNASSVIEFGRTPVRPRADAIFKQNESLWYVFEVANPADPANVVVRGALRSAADPAMKTIDLPKGLTPLTGGRYIGGYELPLKNLTPGNYTLYVTVEDGSRKQLRRADFTVVE
jgi:GWxTD domain-containing protein